MIVRELYALFGIKVDKKSAKKVDDTLQDSLKKLKEGVKKIGAVWAASKTYTALIGDVAALGDRLDKTSQQLGISTQQLQSYGHAAELSGLSTEGLLLGMRTLGKNATAASMGSKEMAAGFEALGISTRAAGGGVKSSQQLLGEMADAFQKMPDGSKKTALAMRLVGDAGATMIPMLNAGAAGIKSMMNEASELGATMSGKLVADTVEYTDNLSRLSRISEAFKNMIGKNVIPMINKLVGWFVKWWKANKEIVGQKVDRVLDLLGAALKGVWEVAQELYSAWMYFMDALDYTIPGLKQTVIGFAILAAVIGSPTLLILLFVAALQDIYRWVKGDGKTAFGELFGDFERLRKIWNDKGAWASITEALHTALSKWDIDFKGTIQEMRKAYFGWVKEIVDLTAPLLELFLPKGMTGKIQASLKAMEISDRINEMAASNRSLTPDARARIQAQQTVGVAAIPGAITDASTAITDASDRSVSSSRSATINIGTITTSQPVATIKKELAKAQTGLWAGRAGRL